MAKQKPGWAKFGGKGKKKIDQEQEKDASAYQANEGNSLDVRVDEWQDILQHSSATSTAVVGLSNLGNTCFFNSSLQLLLACAPLQVMLLQSEHQLSKGPLGFALQQAALYAAGKAPAGTSSSFRGGNSAYNPQSLLSAVCCHAPVFRGRQQHDSHELMRMLLDGLQMQEQRFRDLSRRSSSGSAAGHSPPLQQLPNGTKQQANSREQGVLQSESGISSSSSNSSGSVVGSDAGDATSERGELNDGSSSFSSSLNGKQAATATAAATAAGTSCAALMANGLQSCSISGAGSSDDDDEDVDPEGGRGDGDRQWQLAQEHKAQEPLLPASAPAAAKPPGGMQGSFEAEQSELDDATCVQAPSDDVQSCATCGNRLQQGIGHGTAGQRRGQQQQQQQPQPLLNRKSLLPPEPPKSAGNTSIDEVFGGVLMSTIVCSACGYTSISYEPFLDLSLPVPAEDPAAPGLARKASLLSRLTSRSNGGGKKKAGKAAAAAPETAAAATNQPDDAAPDSTADGANASEQKKLTHKERRRLQQEAARLAREQKKLGRKADKQWQQQQQQQQQSQEPELHEALGDAVGLGPEGVAESVEQQPQQQCDGAAVAAAEPPSKHQQAASCGNGEALAAAGRAESDDTGSSNSTWTDVAPPAAASPPNHTMGCFGGGARSLDPLSPKAAQASSTAGSTGTPARPLHRRFSSLGSLSAFTSSAKGGLSSLFTNWPGRQNSRERESLDHLATQALNSLAQGNAEGVAAGTAGGPGRGGDRTPHEPPPPRPASAMAFISSHCMSAASATGNTSSSSSNSAGRLSPMNCAGPGGSVRHSDPGSSSSSCHGIAVESTLTNCALLGSANPPGVGSATAEGRAADWQWPGDESTPQHQQQQQPLPLSPSNPGLGCHVGALVSPGGLKCSAVGFTIPEEQPVILQDPPTAAGTAASGAPHLQQWPKQQYAEGEDQVDRAGKVPGAGEDSLDLLDLCANQVVAAHAALDTAHADVDVDSHTRLVSGLELPEQQHRKRRPLQRANSDDFVVRLGSAGRLGNAEGAAPHLAKGPAAPLAPQEGSHGKAGSAGIESALTQAAAAAAAAAGAASGATGTTLDPFAAAAVPSLQQPLSVSHCMASFFLREEITWDCPKEKVLWREQQRQLTSSGAGAGSTGDGCCCPAPEDAVGVAIPGADNAAAAAACGSCESGPIYKQVSFSLKDPQVILVPGSVEQRGTDLAAALAGTRPFTRPLTCNGAALLLTAQLRDISVSQGGSAASLAGLRLGLAVVIAGGSSTSGGAVHKDLQVALPLQLGELVLPNVQALSADASGALIQHWAQLVLNCMADLVLHEGGLTGLQSMMAGGVSLLRSAAPSAAASLWLTSHQEQGDDDDDNDDEGEWKVRGHLPAGARTCRAAVDGNSTCSSKLETAAAGRPGAGAEPGAESSSSGYWEYPAASAAGLEDLACPMSVDRHCPHLASFCSTTDEGSVLLQQRRAMVDEQAAAASAEQHMAGRLGQGQGQAPGGEEDMFAMDEDEQAGLGSSADPVQAWEADAAAGEAAAASAGARGPGRANNNGPSLFRKFPADDITFQQQQEWLHTPMQDGSCGVLEGTHSSNPAPAPASQPVHIAAPRSAAADAAGASGTPPGASPAAGTPGSLRRSSLRRKSATFSRSAHKSYRVYLAPPVLMLHLKRFQHDGKGRLSKLDTAVKFDFQLDLGPYMAATAPGAAAAVPAADEGVLPVAGVSNAGSPGAACAAADDGHSLMYDLVGVVVHMGSMKGGHYIAYVKRALLPPEQQQQTTTSDVGGSSDSLSKASRDSSSSRESGGGIGMFANLPMVGGGNKAAAAAALAAGHQWYYVSDSTVKQVNRTEVASCQPYMLMYVRRSSNSNSGAGTAVPEATLGLAADNERL